MYNVHYPLAVAYKPNGEFTDEERNMIRQRASKRSINDTMSIRVANDFFGGSIMMLFDIYNVEELGFFQLLRHKIRKIFTTVAGYVGLKPILVIIIGDVDGSAVDRTLPMSYSNSFALRIG